MIGTSFAAVFIFLVGGVIFLGVVTTFLRNRKIMNQVTEEVFRQARPPARSGSPSSGNQNESGEYSCDNCGASLDSETEISPSGDFKCRYCNSWSNVNR